MLTTSSLSSAPLTACHESTAHFTRDGYFDEIDLCIFTHVSSNLNVAWGQPRGTGLISVEYTFEGESAHAAGSPWRGRSAAYGVELMNIGWQYAREHLNPLHRSHSVIKNGGDQPNVVPSKATIWYYFRHVTYPGIMEVYQKANRIAEGAALMSDTKVTRKVLGSAWPRHFNKVIAEAMYLNIREVGLPEWSEDDQTLARALQKEVNTPVLRYNQAEGNQKIQDITYQNIWRNVRVVIG